MIQITQGRDNKSMEVIAEEHWLNINPFSLHLKRYYKGQSLIDRIIRQRDFHLEKGDANKVFFYNLLLVNEFHLLRKLILSPVSDLPELIVLINNTLKILDLFPLNDKNHGFGMELLDVWNYDNWRSNGSGSKLFELLNIDICPYCNIETMQLDSEKELLIATFDHFYNKATYPYLSLSFNNLIPVCNKCNGPYKGSTSFCISSHLHPYLDSYDKKVKFNTDFLEGASNYKISIEYLDEDQRCVSYNTTLGIENRHNHLSIKKEAPKTYKISQHYPKSRKMELVAEWRIFDLDDVEMRICREEDLPIKQSDILNHLAGKLKRDLAIKNKIISLDNKYLEL